MLILPFALHRHECMFVSTTAVARGMYDRHSGWMMSLHTIFVRAPHGRDHALPSSLFRIPQGMKACS
jgi:hypothetical protein